MLLNYLFIALQSLKRQPVFSAIKILSLAIGLGCSLLVIMHVQYANSFDKHFPNWQNTYRLVSSFNTDQRMNTEINADPWGPQLVLDYPQIESLARIRGDASLFSTGEEQIRENFFYVEPSFMEIIGLDFISGDRATALTQPYSVVISESIAEKYFPDEDALGKTFTVEEQIDVQVSGVFRDLPKNTHLEFDILTSADTGRQVRGQNFMQAPFWFSYQGTRTYLTIPNKADAELIAADLEAFIDRNFSPPGGRQFAKDSQLSIYLENVGDIYFSEYVGFGGTNPRFKMLLGLSMLAVLILITSCINFINLSMSQIQQRSKEIGVRKTLGASRGSIMTQFLFESLLLTLIALIIAIPFILTILPTYTNLTNTDFTFMDSMRDASIFQLVGFVIMTGTLSGLVPAWYVSRSESAEVIKGELRYGRIGRFSRPLVTVLQFGFSTAIIITALAMTQQIRFLNNMDLGFNKENLIVLNANLNRLAQDSDSFTAMINEFRQGPGIISVATADARPPGVGGLNPWSKPSFPPGETRSARHFAVDEQYLDTLQFRFLAGRGFSLDYMSDFQNQEEDANLEPDERPSRGVVIAEHQVSNFELGSPEEAIGQEISLFGNRFRVIGVIENFRFSGGLEDPLQSTGIFRAALYPRSNIFIRIDPAQAILANNYIDEVWSRHRPGVAVDRIFFEQIYAGIVNRSTDGISVATRFSSVITVFISIFGLYALAFYSTQKRTKEVGIRKVLGAHSGSIIQLLAWSFLKPVLISCLLAWGIAWFAINYFLEQFTARADISLWVFAAVALMTVFIALLTVISQCYKTANADPVQSLRYE